MFRNQLFKKKLLFPSKAVATLGVGGSLGAIVLNLLSGYVCEHVGWSVVFYLVGKEKVLFCNCFVKTPKF